MKINKTTKKEIFITAPPAKAYSLRAILLSGMAEGESVVRNPLLAADQLAMIDSLRRLGVEIANKGSHLVIKGGKFSPVKSTLDLNESGVGMNFLSSAAALAGQPIIISGKEGLLRRPIKEVVDGLAQLGCNLEYLDKKGYPPVKNPGTGIPGGTAKMSGAKTSQYFSSLAISAPFADSPVTLECTDEMTEKPYLDITLEMMEIFGVKSENRDYNLIKIPNDSRYKAVDLAVEGDFSSASYFFTAAAVCGSVVHVKGLNTGSLQGDKKVLDLLERMGCTVIHGNDVITVTGGPLNAIETDMSDTPDMVPSVAIAAAFAEGTTILRNVGHLRFKECNRLQAVSAGLERMGIDSRYDETSMYITGNPDGVRGADIDACNDHRIAMAFATAGLRCGDVVIGDEKCVAKSFPDFWDRLKAFY